MPKQLSRLAAPAADPGLFRFGVASTRGRYGGSSPIAVCWSIRLLAIVSAVMCTSSAWAFDAAHILHIADVIARRDHSLGVQWHEAQPNNQLTWADCTIVGRSWLAVQQVIPNQPGRTEEIGKQ